jgi:hypothetical protein
MNRQKPNSTCPPSLSEKIALKRAGRFAACPVSAQLLLARCWTKKASPRAAVRAFCQECCGYDRAMIADCTAWACPLFEYRPYQEHSTHGSVPFKSD